MAQDLYRHVKSGGIYKYIGEGSIEATLENVVIYKGTDGNIWVRPYKEFHDGRFVPVDAFDPDQAAFQFDEA